MQETTAAKGHPKGLYILFATEMWERFNFYGMRSILVLFMTEALLFHKDFASNLYGSYISLVYLTPLLGGFMADRYWGNRRSIIAGGLVMAAGEAVLFCCGTVYHSAPQLATFLFFTGLGLMITGNGFFKPNISSLVGQLYPKTDTRKDAAYTIFYMGINTGGMLGPLICGLVGERDGHPEDFRWAFLVGGIGMIISVIVQLLFQHKYVTDPDKKQLGTIPANTPKALLSPTLTILGFALLASVFISLLYLDTKINFLFYLLTACFVLVPTVIFLDKTLTKIEKDKVIVIFVICFFVIFFWGAFEQAGASLTFFAKEQTDRHTPWFKIPVWAIAGISVLLLWYIVNLFKKAAKNLASDFDKQLRLTVHGLLILFGTAIVALNIYLFGTGKTIVGMDEIPASWFQSLNSAFVVLFAPLFAWLWTVMGKRQPSSITKTAIGLFMLGMGYLWIGRGVDNVLPGIKVSMIWLTGMYALHTTGELCLSPIGMSLVNKLSPLKYSSLLMAIWFTANAFGNKLAGVLSAVYPPGAAEIDQAKQNGIDLATILANKASPSPDVAAKLKALEIPYEYKTFLGYHINNLYDFFMLFVVMAVVASIILFVFSSKLRKMMHEDDGTAVIKTA
jgi:POT family proton-dependent oligopeptide transporter